MLLQPRFQPHFNVEMVDHEGVFLLWETGQAVLEGRLYQLIAPLIDGRRSSDEIVEALSDAAPPAHLYYALEELEKRGYLVENDEQLPLGEAALWSLQGIAPGLAAQRLARTSVSVSAVGKVDAGPLCAALAALGVHVTEAGAISIVLTDDYLRSGLKGHNEESLAMGRPLMLVKPVGRQIWLGPLFRPGRTGCWQCLAQRLAANRPTDCYVAAKKRGGAEPSAVARAATPASLQIAWNLAAHEATCFIVRGSLPDREGVLLTVDTLTWKTQQHTLLRQPDCPACGGAERSSRPGVPIVLASQRKRYTRDGGHRVVGPETTLARYEHHVSPITGVITSLSRCGPPSHGVLHVYESGQNLAESFTDLSGLRRSLRSGKSGKGASDVQARASALCEGLERYSGVFRGDEPRRRARYIDLGEQALHPNACMLYSNKQYRESALWNRRNTRYNYVPSPLPEDAEISWTPVYSLTQKRPRFIPTAYCYYGFLDPDVAPFAMTCSNGTAAGNTLEEAILQGFLELVERDGVALWWYNRLRKPAVDVASFQEPYLEEAQAFLASRHRDLWVLDLTADLEIPVFAALSRRFDKAPQRILLGFGAHLDARIALLRAVTELHQMLAWAFPMESDPPEPLEDDETRSWLESAAAASQPYVLPDPAAPPRQASQYAKRWHDDLRDDLLFCQSLVERNGMELLVLDQTRSDIGLSVVKVFVPGLRHFWARFAPGRLYDIPVRLGWMPRPLSEEELNPIPMFI